MKLNSAKLRKIKEGELSPKSVEKHELYIILDNVLDTYNVGAVFRLADAVAAKKIFLCGYTETPPNTRIKKASINTVDLTEWEHYESAAEAIRELRTQNPELRTIAIEQSPNSIEYSKVDYKYPIALVVGNETHGVSEEVLKIADQIVELPMFGVNVSLNVMVSLAIVLYKALEKINYV